MTEIRRRRGHPPHVHGQFPCHR